MTGTIVRLKLDKGFGFIARSGEPEALFFHVHALQGGLLWDEALLERRVSFDMGKGRDGRPRAEFVRPIED